MTGAIPDKSFATSLTPLRFALYAEPTQRRRPEAPPLRLLAFSLLQLEAGGGLTSAIAYC